MMKEQLGFSRPVFDDNKQQITYDLLGDPNTSKAGVLFLHGFGGSRHHLRCLAETIVQAQNDVVAMLPDLLSLTKGGTWREIWIDQNVRSAQERNVKQVLEHVKYMTTSELSSQERRYALVGHSAGGAIALEAAVALQQQKSTPPSVVVLLDAVPWTETIDLAAQFDPTKTLLVCIQCEPSMWNKQGIPLDQAMEKIPGKYHVKIHGARHGDAMPPSRMTRMLGIASSNGTFQVMRELMHAALCDGLLNDDKESLKELVQRLAQEGKLEVI